MTDTTKNVADQSFFVFVRDSNTGKIRRMAIPGDVQIGLQDNPAELQLLGRLSLSTKDYSITGANQGILFVSNDDTIVSITLIDTPTTGRITVQLPANPRNGQLHFIKDMSGTSDTVPIDVIPPPGVFIDQFTSRTMTDKYGSIALYWFGDRWRILVSGLGLQSIGAAPLDATYVTLSNNASLTNERRLDTAGTNLTLTDNGANSTVKLDLTTILGAGAGSFTYASLTVDAYGRVTAIANGTTPAPEAAAYVTVGNDGGLSNERALTAGTGISIVDNGANSSIVISATEGGGGADVSASYLVIGVTGSLPNERELTAGTNISFVDSGPGGTFVINASGGGGGGGSGADVSASYVVIGVTGSLPNERALTAGSGISIQDNGANNTVVISATGGGGAADGADVSGSYVTLNSTGSLPNERVLVAGSGVTITDNGPGGSVSISANTVDGFVQANYAFVTSSVQWNIPTGSIFVGEPNLTASITTAGDPVFLTVNANYTAQSGTPTGIFSIARNGLNLGHPTWGMMVAGPQVNSYNNNVSITFVDFPPAGTYSYSFIGANPTGSGLLTAYDVGPAALIAFEMIGANVVTASTTTQQAVPNGNVPGLSASITPTKGPVLAIASVNYSNDGANQWAHNTIHRDGNNLGSTLGLALTVGTTAGEMQCMSTMVLDQGATLNTTNTYNLRATNGAGTGVIGRNGQLGTLILWELKGANFKTATTPTNVTLGASYTDVVPVSPTLALKSTGRPVLMGTGMHVNTSAGAGRSGWTFLRNGASLASGSKGFQLVDGEGNNDWDKVPTMFWLDTTHNQASNTYQVAGKNVSGSNFTAQGPTLSTFFLYELDAGDSIVAGGWLDSGNRLSTTASIAISAGTENLTNPQIKGQDVFFYVSGTVGVSTASNPQNARVSLFGGDVRISGSLTVGSGSVKITSNDIQFGDSTTRIERIGNELKFFDANNAQGQTLIDLATGGGGVADGADVSGSYVTLNSTGSLPNERVLTAGTGISIIDGGPGGAVTINNTLIVTGSGRINYHDSTYNPVGLWQLSGSLTDDGSKVTNLTLGAGTSRFTNMGAGLRGFAFDGASILVNTASLPASMCLTGACTVELFANIEPSAAQQTLFAINGNLGDATGAENYLLQFSVTQNGTLSYFAEQNAGSNISYEATGACIPFNELCHLAMSRDGSNVIRFYVNGSLLATSTALAQVNTGSAGASTARITIGSDAGASFSVIGPSPVTKGSISSVKLVDRQLTDAEIGTEYWRTLGNLYNLTAFVESVPTPITRGIFANRPVAGTAGNVYYVTDGPISTFFDDGSSWNPVGPNYSASPLASTFDAINAGGRSTTFIDHKGCLLLSMSNGTTANDYRIRKVAAGATPYELIVHMIPTIESVNYSGCGVCWRESSTGNATFCGVIYETGNINIVWRDETASNNGSSPTFTFSSDPFGRPTLFSQSVIGSTILSNGIWFKLTDNGTTKTFSYSMSANQDWVLIDSQASTTFITPDEVGIWVANINNAGTSTKAVTVVDSYYLG